VVERPDCIRKSLQDRKLGCSQREGLNILEPLRRRSWYRWGAKEFDSSIGKNSRDRGTTETREEGETLTELPMAGEKMPA